MEIWEHLASLPRLFLDSITVESAAIIVGCMNSCWRQGKRNNIDLSMIEQMMWNELEKTFKEEEEESNDLGHCPLLISSISQKCSNGINRLNSRKIKWKDLDVFEGTQNWFF